MQLTLIRSEHSESSMTLYAFGPQVWEFVSHDNPQWRGTIQRHSPQRYSITTNGEQISSHEMMVFVTQYQIISFGGRQ